MYPEDTKHRLLWAMLNRWKAPVALILALAMFVIPISDLGGMFAANVGSNGQVQSSVSGLLKIGPIQIWDDNRTYSEFEIETGKTFLLSLGYSISMVNTYQPDQIQIKIPVDLSVIDETAIAWSRHNQAPNVGSFKIITESDGTNSILFVIKRDNVSGGQESGVIDGTIWLSAAFLPGVAGISRSDYEHCDTASENPAEWEIKANLSATMQGDASAFSQEIRDQLDIDLVAKTFSDKVDISAKVTALAEEDWTISKQVNPKVGSGTSGNKVTVDGRDYWRFVYTIAAEALNNSAYGRYPLRDIRIVDAFDLQVLKNDEAVSYPAKPIVRYATKDANALTTQSKFSPTPIDADGNGLQYLIGMEHFNKNSDNQVMSTTFYVVVDFECNPYITPYNEKGEPDVFIVGNTAELDVTYLPLGWNINSNSILIHRNAEAGLALSEMYAPKFGGLNIQKKIMVNGADVVANNVYFSGANWMSVYPKPVFVLERVGSDNSVQFVETFEYDIANGTKPFAHKPIPGVTYRVYEQANAAYSGVEILGVSADDPDYVFTSGQYPNGPKYIQFVAQEDISLNFTFTNTSVTGMLQLQKKFDNIGATTDYLTKGPSVTFQIYQNYNVSSGVYSDEIGAAITIEGNKDDVHTIHGLPYSDSPYYLVELDAPAGYIPVRQEVYVSRNQVHKYELLNKTDLGYIVIEKKFLNANGESITPSEKEWKKVSFNVYNENGTAATLYDSKTGKTLDSNKVGLNTATSTEKIYLKPGTYYVEEASSADGYSVVSGKLYFEIIGARQPGAVLSEKGELANPIVNKAEKGSILVVKLGANDLLQPINNNVRFTVYNADGVTVVGNDYINLTVTDMSYTSFFEGALPTEISGKWTKNMAPALLIDGLNPGTYWVREVKAPDGFDLGSEASQGIKGIKVVVTASEKAFVKVESGKLVKGSNNSAVFVNDPFLGISVEKRAYGTGESKALKGAEFDVWMKQAENDYVLLKGHAEGTTSENKVTFALSPAETNKRELIVVEAKTPAGHAVPSYVNELKDRDQSERYNFANIPAENIFTWDTSTSQYINKVSGTSAAVVYNEPEYRLKIDKKDQFDKPVDSAIFAVYENVVSDATFEFTFAANSVHNANYLEVGKTYVVKEVAVGSNYILGDVQVTLRIGYANTSDKIVVEKLVGADWVTIDSVDVTDVSVDNTTNTITFTAKNVKRVEATLNKYGVKRDGSGAKVAGAVFAVYEVEAVDGQPGTYAIVNGSDALTGVGVKEPDAQFRLDATSTLDRFTVPASGITITYLDPGKTYAVYEISPPEGFDMLPGYKMNQAAEISVRVGDESMVMYLLRDETTTIEKVEVDVYNPWNLGRLRVYKFGYDPVTKNVYGKNDDGYFFFNGVFDVFGADKKYVTTLYGGTEFPNSPNSALSGWLPSGVYYVVEQTESFGNKMDLKLTPQYAWDESQNGFVLINQSENGFGGSTASVHYQQVKVEPNGKTVSVTFGNVWDGLAGNGGDHLWGRVKLSKHFMLNNTPVYPDGVVFEVYGVDYENGQWQQVDGGPVGTIVTGTIEVKSEKDYGTGMSMAFNLTERIENMQKSGKLSSDAREVTLHYYVVETFIPDNIEGMDATKTVGPFLVSFTLVKQNNRWTVVTSDDVKLYYTTGTNTDGVYVNEALTKMNDGKGILNTSSEGILEIVKYSKNDSKKSNLSGAKFAVFYDKALTMPVFVNGQPAVLTEQTNSYQIKLPYGEYYLKELEAPANHFVTEGALEHDGGIKVFSVNKKTVTYKVPNPRYGDIVFVKADPAGKEVSDSNATVTVALYKSTGAEVGTRTVSTTASAKMSGTFENLEDGNYYLQEIAYSGDQYYASSSSLEAKYYFTMQKGVPYETSADYVKADEQPSVVRILVKNPMKGKLSISKSFLNFKDDLLPAADNRTATFAVYASPAQEGAPEVAKLTLNSSSQQTVYLEPGTYYLKEVAVDAKDATGVDKGVNYYQPLTDYPTFTIEGNDQYYAYTDDKGELVVASGSEHSAKPVVNVDPRGQLRIFKNDGNEQEEKATSIYGATFVIYGSDESGAVDVTKIVYDRVTTNASGYVYRGAISLPLPPISTNPIFNNNNEILALPAGTYYVQEITAPPGYLRSEEIHKLEITANTVSTLDINSVVIHNAKLVDLTLVKHDSTDYDWTLAGAQFAVYRADIPEAGEPVVTDYTELYVITMDADGTKKLENLDVGYYRLVEVLAPYGYQPANTELSSTELQFIVTGAEEENRVVDIVLTDQHLTWNKVETVANTAYIANSNKGEYLRVVKQDSSTEPTSYPTGAVFAVYKAVPDTASSMGYKAEGEHLAILDAGNNYTCAIDTAVHSDGFIVREIKAPEGYTLDPRTLPDGESTEKHVGLNEMVDKTIVVVFENRVLAAPPTTNLAKKIIKPLPENSDVSEIEKNDYDFGLFENKAEATYRLRDLYPGGNKVQLHNFAVSDGNANDVANSVHFYQGLDGTGAEVTTDVNYTFNSVRVYKATDSKVSLINDNPLSVVLYAYAKDGQRSTFGPFSFKGENADSILFDLANRQTVYFEVVYGRGETLLDFSAVVDTEFTPGVIEVDVTFAKRDGSASAVEVLSITNTAYSSFGYQVYDRDGKVEKDLVMLTAESNKVVHNFEALPNIEARAKIVKESIPTPSDKDLEPKATINYSITVSNVSEDSQGTLYQPVVIDIWEPTKETPKFVSDAAFLGDYKQYVESADPAVVEGLGTPTVTVENDYIIWHFPGELPQGAAFTIRYPSQVVALFPINDSTMTVNNNAYLASGRRVVRTAENPYGMTFRDNQGALKPSDNQEGFYEHTGLDEILAGYFKDTEWGKTVYLWDDTLLSATASPSVYFVKEVKGTLDVEAGRDYSSSVIGKTRPGSADGKVYYRLTVRNTNVDDDQPELITVANLRLVDSLPYHLDKTTDTGKDGTVLQDRGTEWEERPVYASHVVYKTDQNGVLTDITNSVTFYSKPNTYAGQQYLDTSKTVESATNVLHKTGTWTANDWIDAGWTKLEPNDYSNAYQYSDIGFDFSEHQLSTNEQFVIELVLDVPELSDPELLQKHVGKLAINNAALQYTSPSGYILNPMKEGDPVKVTLMPADVPIALGDYVWEDWDYDGDQDEELKLGLEGMRIELWRRDWNSDNASKIGETVTDQDGKYYFFNPEKLVVSYLDEAGDPYPNTAAYEYQLRLFKDDVELTNERVTNRDGSDFTYTEQNAAVADKATDSDCNELGETKWFSFNWFDIVGEYNKAEGLYALKDSNYTYRDFDGYENVIFDPTWDFGLHVLSSIGDRVWYDADWNGYQDVNHSGVEAGVDGITVSLYRYNMETETWELFDGEYPVGHESYGKRLTGGLKPDGINSFKNGEYYFYNLPGNAQIWQGIADAGEDPEAVEAFLKTTMEQEAEYPFLYRVEFDISSLDNDIVWTKLRNSSGYPFNINDGYYNNDSNAITAMDGAADRIRRTATVILGYDEDNDTVDAGVIDKNTIVYDNYIGDYMWLDTGRDGLQNEPASNGWNGLLVELINADTGATRSMTTGNNVFGLPAGKLGDPGYYLFENIEPGRYFIRFWKPGDHLWTLGYVGNDDWSEDDSNIIYTNNTDPYADSRIFIVTETIKNLSFDAGFYKPSTPPPYNPPNTGTTTTVTIPGGTPAGTELVFTVNNESVSFTVPVDIPVDRPFSTSFDPSTTPMVNLPQLINDEIAKDPEYQDFVDKTPKPTIPATMDNILTVAFWGFVFLAAVAGYHNVKRRKEDLG